VGVAARLARQAHPDINELPDPTVAGQKPDDPGEVRAVCLCAGRHLRAQPHDLLGRMPVGVEMVLAAEPVVIDAGRVRHRGVKPCVMLSGRENRGPARLVDAWRG
jgi:hypothetical protein